MGKNRDFFKKIGDSKGTFRAKMDTIKDRKGKELTETEHIKKWQEHTALLKKGLNDCWEAQCKIALKEEVRGKMAKRQKYPDIVY